MHYYSHNINDFNNATIHLSVEEECMYHRALAWYYSNELPLPSDKNKIYRYLRATTKKLQKAVDMVLEDFFILEDDGYHQARCDEEIAEYKKKQEVASNAGKASANARKKKAEQDENNQQANDEHHINDRSTAVQQEINDRSTTVQPTNNHKPITNNIYTHTNAREQNFCSLADWQPPPMQEMQSELLRAGVNVTLNASQYQIALQDFKAYYDNQATLGKPLNTDFVRRQKFRQWLSRSDSKKPTNRTDELAAMANNFVENFYSKNANPKLGVTHE